MDMLNAGESEIQETSRLRELEKKLEIAELLYSQLAENTRDIVYHCDATGFILYASPSLLASTGYDAAELKGRHERLLYHPDDARKLGYSAERSAVRTRVRYKSGKTAWYVTVSSTLTGENGEVLIHRIGSKISDPPDLDFLATASREVRMPLNGVIGMTELLMDTTKLDSSQRAYIEVIKKSGETLLETIRDIMDYAYIDAGGSQLALDTFDVRKCIYEALDQLTSKAREKELRLSVSLSPDIPSVLIGDEARLKQVILNLAGDGIERANAGRISVSICRQESRNGAVTLRFEIKAAEEDPLAGTEQNRLAYAAPEKVFDGTFSRPESESLAMVLGRRLVGLMGGEVRIGAYEGLGELAFTVVLRESGIQAVTGFEAADGAGTKVRDEGEVDKLRERAVLRILIAEDNRTNQLVLNQMLERLGHSVKIVEDGDQVIEAALSEPYDIIFMDILMPGITGLEAAGLIKDALRPEECPVIVAVTANALQGDREICLEAGMDEYVSKPITGKVIEDLLNRFF